MKVLGETTYREIYGQPETFEAVANTFGTLTETAARVFSGKSYEKLIFTGCGTSFYLAQTAAFFFARLTDFATAAVPCSELYYFPQTYIKDGPTLVLPITRKSYTTEVRMAIDRVRELPNVSTLAITCDPDSAAYNDHVALSPNAPEDSIVMTRSYTSMVYLSLALAAMAGGKQEMLPGLAAMGRRAKALLPRMDAFAARVLQDHPSINLYVFLGQGAMYGAANECMNKVKEMSLSASEAYPSLEYRHGPMSLADENTLVMLLGAEETLSNDAALLAQLKDFGVTAAVVAPEASRHFPMADYALDLEPGYSTLENVALAAQIGQFLGYHASLQKKLDADTPRHLSQAIVLNP